jgi:hypothetical protein
MGLGLSKGIGLGLLLEVSRIDERLGSGGFDNRCCIGSHGEAATLGSGSGLHQEISNLDCRNTCCDGVERIVDRKTMNSQRRRLAHGSARLDCVSGLDLLG